MHASIEQLLELRDQRPVAAEVLLHVEGCIACRQRLDEHAALRESLRALPDVPAPNLWRAISARVQPTEFAPRTKTNRYAYWLTVAASSVLVATLAVTVKQREVTITSSSFPPPAVAVAATPAILSDTVAAADPVLDSGAEPGIAELVNRSHALESVLRALPERRVVQRAGTTATIMGLEDGVALIDYRLTREGRQLDTTQSRELWQRRVDLLNSLVNVRYAEAQPAVYQP
jgi:hypothetical protein